MRDYHMFTAEGNAAVQKIVDGARQLMDVSEYGIEPVWNWAQNELVALTYNAKFEEATDTAVREAVYDAII
jgi:hypothetical protein